MSVGLLEQLVFAKPYFDRHGLIVAEQDGTPVGFAHAGFGPSQDMTTLDQLMGVTCVVMVNSAHTRGGLSEELLGKSELYLQTQGSQVIYGGAINPLNPFYLGLYGGSEMPGILDSDPKIQELYQSAGYQEVDRVIVLQRQLNNFRPPVDRKQMQVRRATVLESELDPLPESWWEACTTAGFDRFRFRLVDRSSRRVAASVTFRAMGPFSTSWGVQAIGLVELFVLEPLRRQGHGTFLVSEALRHFQTHGVMVAEVQTMQRNTTALAFYQSLGFVQVDSGAVYRKNGPGDGRIGHRDETQ
jgi:GNAT superfamily N-acetyltransferase